MGVFSGPREELVKDLPRHYMEGKEEELREKVIFGHKHLAASVKAAAIPCSVSTLRVQELPEVVFNCPKFLVCVLHTLCWTDAASLACTKKWGTSLSQPHFVPQIVTPRRSTRWSIAASGRHSVGWDWAGRLRHPPKFEVRSIPSSHTPQPVRRSTKER